MSQKTKQNIGDLQWPALIGAGFFLIMGLAEKSVVICLIGVACGIGFFLLYNKNKKEGFNPNLFKPNSNLKNHMIKQGLKQWAMKPLLLLGLFLMLIGMLGSDKGYSFLAYLGALCLGLLLYFHFKKTKPPVSSLNDGSTAHGSADWSAMPAILNAGYNGKAGLWIGGGYTRKKSGHLLTVAGSGQGKGTCLIIPTLLSDPVGSYVITDPKGENACITARFQKSAGQNVYILDPWGEQTNLKAQHEIPAAGFNPFVFIKDNMDELRDNCEQIAYFLVPDKPDVKDPYWNDRARSMIKTFLMHIVTALPEQEHNFWTLYKMLRLAGDEWLTLLADLKMNEAQDGLISIAAQEIIGLETSGNTMAGIKSTAQNATTIFESPQLRRSLEKNDFSPYDLADGKITLYIVIPERFLDTHATWLRLVIGLCLKACNSRPQHRVNFILDEFPVMGKMKDVQRGYAFGRGQNIVLWAFVQSLSQLKEIYGEDGMNTFISNAAVFQAFGVKDHFTTEYVSKLLGEGTFQKASETYSNTGEHGSVSTNYQTYGRRILTPDEVETSPYIITVAEGLRMQLTRLPYFGAGVSLAPKDWSGFDSKTAQEIENRDFNLQEAVLTFKERADPPPRLFH